MLPTLSLQNLRKKWSKNEFPHRYYLNNYIFRYLNYIRHLAFKKHPHCTLHLCWIRVFLRDSLLSCKIPGIVTSHLGVGMRVYPWGNSLRKIKYTTNSDACHSVFSMDFKSKQEALPGNMLGKHLINQSKIITRTKRRCFPVNNDDS